MTKIRVSKIRVSKIRVREIRVREISVSEIRVSEIRVREISVSKIRISSNHRELHGAIFWVGGGVCSAGVRVLDSWGPGIWEQLPLDPRGPSLGRCRNQRL